ncbi:MAG: phytoene/squalene synthase family protein [Rhizobiaceae bacterium]|nr:phytoene/squalene synthase family protein [Rhizobiaceae bacterium]
MSDDDALAADLRIADPDRYLSALYAPQDRRGDLIALYAFNAEIAAIRDRIREALPGEIRLQWWRDALAGNADATGHPLADRLLAAMRRRSLPTETFQNYLEARVFDLYDDPMPTRTDLEGYLGETAGALIQLAAMCLDGTSARTFAALAGHAGCAQGMTGLLRLVPLHRARGQCYIPRDLLAAAGTTPQAFVAGEDLAATARAISAMVSLAREHWRAFVDGAANLPTLLRPAYLPLALTGAYLDRIDKVDLFAVPVELSALRRHWLLFRAASRGFA